MRRRCPLPVTPPCATSGRRSAPIDRGLVLWFPAPASFTGEDMAELHVHGSRAVIRAVIDAVLALAGTRLAEPGEFARRAFENGKLDLTEVEGLADLIKPRPRRSAVRRSPKPKARCARSTKVGATSSLRAQALIEAGLDFADEGDVIADVGVKADAVVAALRASIARHLAERSGERLRDGLRVVIAGPPNAGKSSLLNALAKRDVAIVSEEAGTTRDVIEVHLDLGGVPVMLIDTAGLREARRRGRGRGDKTGIGAGRGRRSRVVAGRCHRAAMGCACRAYPTSGQIRAKPGSSAKPRSFAVLNKIDLAPGAGAGREAVECLGQDRRGHRQSGRDAGGESGARRRIRGRGAAPDPGPPSGRA